VPKNTGKITLLSLQKLNKNRVTTE
jgi:hypothetical protein